MDRRNFIKNAGVYTSIAGGLGLESAMTSCSIEDKQVIEGQGFSNIGPYPHMWQSDDQAPYVEQIGLGLATLKVVGDHSMALPIWPAFMAVDKKKDPIRSVWKPHASSPIEPQALPDQDLSIINRQWLPHVLQSTFNWKATKIEQQIVTIKNMAFARIEFEEEVKDFYLNGESYQQAFVTRMNNGLIVHEDHQKAKTVSYQVVLDPIPSKIIMIPDENKKLWKYEWHKPLKRLTITLKLACKATDALREKEYLTFEEALNNQERSWASYFNKEVVRVATPDDRINKLVDYLGWVYRSNGLLNGGLLKYRFNMPKQTFVQFWMWDCCFNGISGMWYGDRDLVWGNLLNIPHMQVPAGTTSAGCVPNSCSSYGIYMWDSDDAMSARVMVLPHLMDRLKIKGDGSHPPIYAQALEKVWETEGRKLASRKLLESAIQYNDWWERTRSSKRFPGLLLVKRWSDTGMDNSKRWGHQGSGIYDTRLDKGSWSMPIITVDLNVYSVLEKRALANILEHEGDTSSAARYRNEANKRVELIHKHLWSEEAAYYLDHTEEQDMFVPVISPTGAYPLLIEGLTQEREEGIFNYLMDPKHFFTKAPIPSLSVSDPDFQPGQSYWMGPSWMCYTVYILRGMFRTRPDDAWKMFDKILDTLIQQGTPYIFENYNPLTREYYDCQGFQWQCMFVDLILEEILGLKISNGKLVMENPKTPDDWDSFKVKNIYFAGEMHGFEINRNSDRKWEV